MKYRLTFFYERTIGSGPQAVNRKAHSTKKFEAPDDEEAKQRADSVEEEFITRQASLQSGEGFKFKKAMLDRFVSDQKGYVQVQ